MTSIFQWSRHRVRAQFRWEVWRRGERLAGGVTCEQGEGCGTEFGFLTFVPILGNLNFDKGIELALSRCLQKCLESLAESLEK